MLAALHSMTRTAHVWLPGHLKARAATAAEPPRRAWVAIADHFEPGWNGADRETSQRRVRAWATEWPRIAGRHRDGTGRPPQYTFFFPQDQYHPDSLEPLRRMTEMGIADVE